MCKFDRAWIGKCKKENLPDSEYCQEHATDVCCVCGEQATHECPETGGLVCGQLLCDNCEHKIVEAGHNGGCGGKNSHCKKSEQEYYPWFMKDDMLKIEGDEKARAGDLFKEGHEFEAQILEGTEQETTYKFRVNKYLRLQYLEGAKT